MAVIRNTSSQRRVGRVGSDTYYVANGQQIVRQAQNNSNYGESASRSEAQQKRRVRWANLVNTYKRCSSWMKACFETKKRNESDYNKFMSVNMANANICLTKDMAASDCCVLDTFIVSQGSLSPISLTYDDGLIVSDLRISRYESIKSIADLTAQIIANNPGWSDGDGIGLISFYGSSRKNGYTGFGTIYDEIVLDSRDVNQVETQEDLFSISFENNRLCIESWPDWQDEDGDWSVVLIHTRKASKTLVSTQQLEIGNMALSQIYAAPRWEAECIKSYGLTEDYIITPSSFIAVLRRFRIADGDWFVFRGAITRQVTAGVNVVFDVMDGSDASFYIMRLNDKQTLLRQDGYYVLDTSESGTYNIFLNGLNVGSITSIVS